MKIIRKVVYVFLFCGGILFLSYFLQPDRKGEGTDHSTHYELVQNWPILPQGFILGSPSGIDVDTSGNLVVFHRADRTWPLLGSMPDDPIGKNTISVFEKYSGRLLRSWGAGLFIMPHGLAVDTDNNIWTTDVGLHQVFKFSPQGELLMKLGEAGITGKDRLHFNKPTDIAISKDGSIYVSDGYGNNRVIKFSAQGKYMLEWGKEGSGEGEFDLPHGISMDNEGLVYVADRENNRIQVFDEKGKYIRQYFNKSFGAMTAVHYDTTTSRLLAADDFSFLKLKHRGSDVYAFDTSGKVQTRFGRSGSYNGSVCWYHDVAVDKEGNIYAADILGNRIQKFKRVN